MYLSDFIDVARACHEHEVGGFLAFRSERRVRELEWPSDVLEQWLYDHFDHDPFLEDYGRVNLSLLSWNLEKISAKDLAQMPTGASERSYIDEYAEDPNHWIGNHNLGVHVGVSQMWDVHGTWKRWPILIDRSLLSSTEVGLQVVEGRTRVGILKGRLQQGDFVSDQHLAWVGRLR